MSHTSGRVLVIDDDLARLSAISEELRAKGHEVHAAGGGAEARACLSGTGIDVVIANEAVATELGEVRRETARGASWILRVEPMARPPQRGMFIASVPVDATPRAVAETVAVAMMIRRPKKLSRPPLAPTTRDTPVPTRSLEPVARPSVTARQEVFRDTMPAPQPTESRPSGLPSRSFQAIAPRHSTSYVDRHDTEVEAEVEAPPAPPVVAARRQVAVIARDSKIVRRLCECFEEGGLSTRGFTSARTAVDVASNQHFDAMLMEESLDEIDAPKLANRILLQLGERAPRMVVLARPGSVISEPAITEIVRAPATPPMLLEALLRAIDAPPPPRPGDDDAEDAPPSS